MDSRAQHFVLCWFSIIFFLSYYLLEFDEFIFYFYKTYNSRLKERYKNNPSIYSDIYPDLWLETRLSDESDRNPVYELFNTMTENFQTTYSVSTVGGSQTVLSTWSLDFTALLEQGVQERTTHLNEKYEQLSMNYEEFC